LDCDALINGWYAVDDGSSESELAAMQKWAPELKWINKTDDQAGHVGSINALLQVAAAYDYFVWMEDDWFFMKDEHLITKALDVMRVDNSVAQVRAVAESPERTANMIVFMSAL
jgi:GT2 family glycosyltransferase